MATILAHIHIKPGSEAQFEAVACTLFQRSHADDPGLLRYEYWRGQEPGFYYALLAFEDYRAFIVHQTSAHHEAAAPLLQETIAEIKLEWVAPIEGASSLRPTKPQGLGLEASPLAIFYADRIPVTIAEWWPTA